MTNTRKYEEGDIILVTVTGIERTTVFLKTEDGVEGSMVLSEVAPGRIRNLRAYVVPKKVVACKILRIRNNHLFLSLRRVKQSERQELMQEHKKEKSWQGILKKIVGEDSKKIIKQIKAESSLVDYFDDARETPKLLEKYFNKSQIEHVKKILQEKKEKDKEIKKKFQLSSNEPDGVVRIKKILKNHENVTYLGGSNFSIKIIAPNLKQAGSEMNEALQEIEKQAKKQKVNFEAKK